MTVVILLVIAAAVVAVMLSRKGKGSQEPKQPAQPPEAPPVVVVTPPVDPVKPPEPPPPPPPVDPVVPQPPPPPEPTKPTVNYAIWAGLTRAQAEQQKLDVRIPGWNWDDFAASGFMEGVLVSTPNTIDKRTIRDLSVINGPAIVEGPAGTVDYITIKRPVNEAIEVTMGRTNSAFGAITTARISCNGSEADAGGSDAYGKIRFLSTGSDQVKVELLSPGALAVQRN